MQIKDARIYILAEEPPKPREISSRGRLLEKVPPSLTGRHTRATMMHAQDESLVFGYQTDPGVATCKSIIRLMTDGDLDACITESLASLANPGGVPGGHFPAPISRQNALWQAYWFKTHVAPNLVGMDVLDREHIWQKLYYGQRFNGYGRRLVDLLDNALWDLASRYFRQPIFKLLGGRVDKIPAYYDTSGNTIDELVEDTVNAKKWGYKGAKDHSYRGVKTNIQLAKELRAAVGPDFALMHDCVWNYTVEDAIKVGRELERQNYTWMEEPLADFDAFGLKKLCETLDMPILSREFTPANFSGQPHTEAWFLAMGAADIVRQVGLGITGKAKQAQACESFEIPVHGGEVQVALGIGNHPWFETGAGSGPGTPPDDPATLTFQGKTWVWEGYMGVAYGNLPVQEPDWDEIEKKAVEIV